MMMLGQTIFEQPLFSTIDLNTFVPKNHFLRRLDTILDLSFIHKLAKPFYYENRGRPSVDPVTYFRMQIIAYMYGIDSDRRLCEEVHLNMAYRWFTRIPLDIKVPDHSSMTRTRDRLGEDFFQSVFDQILEQCQSIGLLRGERLMVDSSLFEANASPKSLVKIDKDPDIKDQNEERDESNTKRKGTSRKNRSDKKFTKSKSTVTNSSHISKTDPNAKIVSKAGTTNNRLYYKTHHTADADSRVITDCFVTPGNIGENTVTEDRITMQISKYGFKIKDFIADRYYGTGALYKFLDSLNINAYIPNRRVSFNQGHGSNQGFQYIEEKDYYLCKEGHILRPYKTPVGSSGNTFRYRMLGCHCKSCPQKSTCLSGNKQIETETKVINRNIFEDLINKTKEHSQTKDFKAHVYERFWKMEGLFAEAKNNHCLRRSKYRGKEKVQIQVTMTSIVQNLKRILFFTERKMGALQSSLPIADFTTNTVHMMLCKIFYKSALKFSIRLEYYYRTLRLSSHFG